MKTIGFGLIGPGLIGKVHAEAIAAASGAHLIAVCGRDSQKTSEFAAHFGARPFTDVHEFLANNEIQVVTICTPSGSHGELGKMAARAGKHVLVEKPIEITLDRADALTRECELANVKLGVIFQSRLLPAVERLKGEIDNGSFGRLFLGDAYIKWFRAPEYYAPGSWHGSRLLDGGGALINQAIHTVDLLRWMMGPVESVFAYKSALRYPHIESEDTLVAVLKFENGALGVIEATTSVAPGFRRRLEISGEKGTAILDGDDLVLLSLEGREDDAGGTGEQTTDGSSNPAAISNRGHMLHIEDMVRAIRDGGEPLITGHEARPSLEIIEATYLSAKEDRQVMLREMPVRLV
jgi:UDP-N-acetyl-2-amino-2-deoxyglucuronate dehydrogenase